MYTKQKIGEGEASPPIVDAYPDRVLFRWLLIAPGDKMEILRYQIRYMISLLDNPKDMRKRIRLHICTNFDTYHGHMTDLLF